MYNHLLPTPGARRRCLQTLAVFTDFGPIPPGFLGLVASGRWDSPSPTTLLSQAKGKADLRETAARQKGALVPCPPTAMAGAPAGSSHQPGKRVRTREAATHSATP